MRQVIKKQMADGVTTRRVGLVSTGAPARAHSDITTPDGEKARRAYYVSDVSFWALGLRGFGQLGVVDDAGCMWARSFCMLTMQPSAAASRGHYDGREKHLGACLASLFLS